MMYRKIDDFLSDWKTEQEFTLTIFSKIKDEHLSSKPAENIRTLGRLAWHITQTLTEMPFKAGILKKDELEDQPILVTAKEIIAQYKTYSSRLMESIGKTWKDSELTDILEVYGQKWEKRKILSVMVTHQIHHRAQMTIIMRLLNIEVPGIYGPSKEEWVKFGMSPQD